MPGPRSWRLSRLSAEIPGGVAAGEDRGGLLVGGHTVALEFLDQRVDTRMRTALSQTAQNMAAPIVEIDYARRHALRMQRDPQHVDRGLQQ
jgi:hypothetical protein